MKHQGKPRSAIGGCRVSNWQPQSLQPVSYTHLSLEGIQLKKPVSRADVFVRPEIVGFAQRFNNRQAIDRALKQAQEMCIRDRP